MDKQYIVITAIGPDQLGFADKLTKEILDYKGNIEESKMALLGGEFAMLILVSAKCGDCIEQLSSNLPLVGKEYDISVMVKKTTAPHLSQERIPYRIETVSLDTPGIIHTVTAVLMDYRINIEDLETDTSSAPMTGARMFHMRGVVTFPADVHAKEVRERFEDLEATHSLEVILHPLSSSVID
jgi:glycine cleavage system transcriptional repressor